MANVGHRLAEDALQVAPVLLHRRQLVARLVADVGVVARLALVQLKRHRHAVLAAAEADDVQRSCGAHGLASWATGRVGAAARRWISRAIAFAASISRRMSRHSRS